jgi:hypothetical protein
MVCCEAVPALVLEGAFFSILSHSSAIAFVATFSTIPIQAEALACLVFVVQCDSVALFVLPLLGHVSDSFVFETLSWSPRGRFTDARVALGNKDSVI